jgi:hypothetical protein
LDSRIQSTMVSGYFGPRERLWEEPIYRNVFALLERFGDAELASMIAPRQLIVEYSEVPAVSGPPPPRAGRNGAAPGKLWTWDRPDIEEELNRARALFPPNFPVQFELVHGQEGSTVLPGSPKAIRFLTEKLGGKYSPEPKQPPASPVTLNAAERQHRQIIELEDFTQHQITRAERHRNETFWKGAVRSNAEQWQAARLSFKEKFWTDWIGHFPSPDQSINPRSRQIYDEPKWTGYEVVLDVWPGVFAGGILCVPKDLKPDEK